MVDSGGRFVAAGVALLAWLSVDVAGAATFVVDDVGTDPDVEIGDGICATANGGCTFYAAIAEANAFAGPDVVDLPAGTWSATVSIQDDLEVVGVGTGTVAATIFDGLRAQAPLYGGPVFLVDDGVSLTLRGVAIENGYTAVDARGLVTIEDSIIRDQATIGVSGCPLGLTVIDSTFADNTGGNAGGAIACYGLLRVMGSTFTNNSAGNVGGAIACEEAEIVNSTFAHNHAFNSGGAVHADGRLTVIGSTFNRNSALNVGGGISSNVALDLRNSTFIGNSVWNTGGAVHVDGSAVINNVTITRNSAGNIGALGIGSGSSAKISNSILFGNTGENCAEAGFRSEGYNFLEAACIGRVAATDYVGVDPLVGFLGGYGGPTQTAPLPKRSMAVDGGGPDCEPVDQRGVPRPQGAGCDVGAYEMITCNFNGFVDPGEQCDDGNHVDGDGCSSLCESELLSGRKLSLRVSGGQARLVAQLADARIGLGWGNFSADDPVLHGGTLRVMSADGGFDASFDLPATGWKYIGRAGRNRGYKFQDDFGAIRQVKIQPGKSIKVKGGGSLGFSLTSDPNPLHVFLVIGERQYCAAYGGSVRFQAGRSYRAKLAPPPRSLP